MKMFIRSLVIVGLILTVMAQQPQTSVPTDLRRRVAIEPNLPRKFDMLASGVLIVQEETSKLRTDTGAAGRQTLQTLSQQHANDVQTLTAAIADVKNHLIALRNATCPLLKNAQLKDTEKVQVDKVCQSDSAEK